MGLKDLVAGCSVRKAESRVNSGDPVRQDLLASSFDKKQVYI